MDLKNSWTGKGCGVQFPWSEKRIFRCINSPPNIRFQASFKPRVFSLTTNVSLSPEGQPMQQNCRWNEGYPRWDCGIKFLIAGLLFLTISTGDRPDGSRLNETCRTLMNCLGRYKSSIGFEYHQVKILYSYLY